MNKAASELMSDSFPDAALFIISIFRNPLRNLCGGAICLFCSVRQPFLLVMLSRFLRQLLRSHFLLMHR